MNDLQNKFVEFLVSSQEWTVERCMAEHNCKDEEIRQILYETTYEMTVAIMELIDGYSSFSSDKFDIINTVTGERLKENPFVELHDILDGRMKN